MQQKPSFELSGKLAAETNRVRGEASSGFVFFSCSFLFSKAFVYLGPLSSLLILFVYAQLIS